MGKRFKLRSLLLVILGISLLFSACGSLIDEPLDYTEEVIISEDGAYTSKEDVSLYIKTYGKLPENFIKKKDAIDLGWKSREGNLGQVAEGYSIGGDRFGNREGLLPRKKDRQYYECDINYEGGHRGGERIVYSNDGLVYYSPDHYKTFELIYGDE